VCEHGDSVLGGGNGEESGMSLSLFGWECKMRVAIAEVMSILNFAIKAHLVIAGELFLFKINALNHYQLI
jgi:hypothetical protein